VFAAEFFLFDHYGAHRFTALYPRWNDQVQYLGESYVGYEYAREHGFAAGLWHTLVNPSAQGTLHDFGTLIIFKFVGASRSAALALNLLAFIGWQLALFAAVALRSSSRALAFAAAMLPLALCGPWQNIPGAAYDFRLDHLAMCALGVTSAVALLTRGCRLRGWSVVLGVAIGVTLLTRFLTGTYFVLIFAALFIWSVIGADRKTRWINVTIAASVAAALAGPIFWLNREWVWNYYYIGHYVGPESAIRNQHFGLGRSIGFVFGQLAERHIGVFFAIVAAASVIGFAVVRRAGTRATKLADLWIVGAIFVLAPAIVLTLHQQKSEVVVGALTPGVIVLVIALWQTVAGNSVESRATVAISAAIAVASFGYFAQRQLAPGESSAFTSEARTVATTADYIVTRSSAARLDHPAIAADYITDCLDGQVLRIVAYERQHRWLGFEMTLPTGIAAPEDSLVMDRLAHSDFVFLTEDAPTGHYPFDQKLASMRPQLRVWCDEHLRLVQRFPLFGRRMLLYQRREIPLP
jgi:hypothetical protein